MNFATRFPELSISKREMNYIDKDIELDIFCDEMNALYISFLARKKKYDKIMEYWRAQLHRGFITQEQYKQRAKRFSGYSEKNKIQ